MSPRKLSLINKGPTLQEGGSSSTDDAYVAGVQRGDEAVFT